MVKRVTVCSSTVFVTRLPSSATAGSSSKRVENAVLHEPYWLPDEPKETHMLITTIAPLLLGLSALVTSVSALIWSIRRRA